MKTEQEILDFISKIMDSKKRYPGMTYEEGLRDALDWVLGDNDELEEEF